MDGEQKPTPASPSLGRGVALTVGLLLLVALTAYVGAVTAPSSIFAEEEEDSSVEDLRRLKEEKQWFKDNLANTLRQYKDVSRQVKSKSQGPQADITRITKELKSLLKSSGLKKMPQDYRTDVERQANELLNELTELAGRIKTAQDTARTAFDALAPIYQQVAAIKLNNINDLDAFEEARGLEEELRQELNNVGSDLNDANQDFHGGEYWQKKDRIRNLIELPRQLADFEKTLARSEKLTGNKALTKLEKLYPDTFTVTALKDRVKGFKSQVQEIQAALKSGDVEDLQSQVQELHEARIFDLEGAINRLRELGDLLPRLFGKKALKNNAEMRDAINEVVLELVRRVTAGELDNNIHQDFNELMNWLYDMERKLGQRSDFKENDPLFDKIRGLMDKFDRESGSVPETESTQESGELPPPPKENAQ